MFNFNKNKSFIGLLSILIFLSLSCKDTDKQDTPLHISLPTDMLDYSGTPNSPKDRSSLAFSDKGAWFGYGFSDKKNKHLGFSGPFLMTQGLGEWSSQILSNLSLKNTATQEKIDLSDCTITQKSYNSHLAQTVETADLKIEQNLFFHSPHTAFINTKITNLSGSSIPLQATWSGTIFDAGLQLNTQDDTISLSTDRSPAKGYIQTFDLAIKSINTTDSSYAIISDDWQLKPKSSSNLVLSHSFIFPEYSRLEEQKEIAIAAQSPLKALDKVIESKQTQLDQLYQKMDSTLQDSIYKDLAAKLVLSLQNNTRIPAGELKHAGIFPSYHYKWFLGFWAWDSWKHAAAVCHYDANLAKEQIRAMYDYQEDNGFIPDCIFRDTSIERHNYRDTKPPLSAWAVWEVYSVDKDINFIKEMYPKIAKQHQWWYADRDWDKDGICEYGSTDGTLVAAKWESGMDNAVRFDSCSMLKTHATAYSLNQESVDLNAYLYAEKLFLADIAKALNLSKDETTYREQAALLKTKIQEQFFDAQSGWFYDTSIDGKEHIAVMGSEGWTPLWANVASEQQAEAVKNNMINPDFFNTKVPFQTLSAAHPKFEPDGGYWRGPNWLDQAYFGVKGLQNYGFDQAAAGARHKLLHNAEGVLQKGPTIRENYQPVTGAGLESHNFSWSAGHYLLLLLGE